MQTWPEKLSGLSRNRRHARFVTNVNAKLDHGPVVGKMYNNIHWMNLYTVVNTIGFHNRRHDNQFGMGNKRSCLSNFFRFFPIWGLQTQSRLK